jgi:SAM-dependent methyltransferase
VLDDGLPPVALRASRPGVRSPLVADHPWFAAMYDRSMAIAERNGLAERRRHLLAKATGRVLEIGAGTGANLPYYADIERLDLIEPDGAMRKRLETRLDQVPVPVTVRALSIGDVDLVGGVYDTIVTTLVLCTVPDLAHAVDRLRRLLAPTGQLLFLEHVVGTGARGRLQRAASPLWRRVAAGCRCDRDVVGALRAGGFVVTDLERFAMPMPNPLVRPAVQGVARRRTAAGSEEAA